MSSNLLKADSAKKNFTFQLLYQVIILVVPLFVSPYLTRTLGSSALGSYTYNHSIAYYFVIVAQLGISKHGQRVIAQNKHDFTTLRKTYWSLFWTHALMSLLALAAYIIYMIFICASDKAIVYALSLYVLSAFFDITWFFYGIEKFKSISIRNAIVKAVETVLIFSLIKSPADILVYTIIISASVCAGQIIMLPRVIKEIPPIKVGFSDMLAHMKPMIILFSASVAVVLYTVLDKTLLGILSVKDNVAFYEYSNKLINIPKTLINVVSIVLYPKACIYAKNNDFKALENNARRSMVLTSFIGFPSAFGLAAVSGSFVALYYGADFAVCGDIVFALCPIVIIISLGDVVRSQYLYPLSKDAYMVAILCINAIINLVLTITLIPYIGVYGAVIGTTAAETTGLILEFLLCRKYHPVKNFIENGLPLAVLGLVMYGVVKVVASYVGGGIQALMIQVAVGAAVYLLLTLIYAKFFNRILFEAYKSVLDIVVKFIKKL